MAVFLLRRDYSLPEYKRGYHPYGWIQQAGNTIKTIAIRGSAM